MEVIAIVLDYDQIYTNLKFIFVPSVAYAERPGYECPIPFKRTQQDANTVLPYHIQQLADLDTVQVLPTFAAQEFLYDTTNSRFQLWH